MLWFALDLLKSFAASLIDSRLGQMALVGTAAWYFAVQTTDSKWEAQIAAEKAQIEQAYQKELQRQRQASLEIENDAIQRDAEHAATVADMQSTIDDYMKKLKEQPHVVTKERVVRDCAIDGDFAGVVQQLDTPRNRKANPAARAGKLR